jgi:hypothetical protein
MTGTEVDGRRAAIVEVFLGGTTGGGGGGVAAFFTTGGLGMLTRLRQNRRGAYLCSWHLLDRFVKDLLHTFSHRRNSVIRPIESQTILKDQPNVTDELVGAMITWILRVRIGFRGI